MIINFLYYFLYYANLINIAFFINKILLKLYFKNKYKYNYKI